MLVVLTAPTLSAPTALQPASMLDSSSPETSPVLIANVLSNRAVQSLCPEEGERHGSRTSLFEALRARPRGLVIDVGAFDGGDAIKFAMAGHRVYSFEPSPSKKLLIEKAWAASGVDADDLTLYPIAASNETGTTSFWVATEDASSYHRSTTIAGGTLGSEQDQMGETPPPWDARRVSVRVDTLDNVLGPTSHVEYMKIDAQGYDAEVLLGAASLVKSRRIRAVAFEVALGLGGPRALEKYASATRMLAAAGYSCYDCLGAVRRGEASYFTHGTVGLEIESLLQRYDTSHYDFEKDHKVADVKQWTDFVCTAPENTH